MDLRTKALGAALLPLAWFAIDQACAEELDPGTLTKYLDPLPVPGAMAM